MQVETQAPEATGTPQTTQPEQKPAEKNIASDKFAALAHRDRQISKKAQEIAAAEARVKELQTKYEAQLKEFEETKKGALSNPLEAMKKLGLTYEQVTEYILNKEKPTPDAKLEALRQEMMEWRQAQEMKEKKALEDAQKQKEEGKNQAVTQYKESIAEYAAGSKDLELLNYLDSKQLINLKDMVYNGIVMVNRDTKKIPTIEEACAGTQEYLLGQLEEVINNVSYFKNKYAPKQPQEQTPDGSTPVRTLTNDMTSGTPGGTPAYSEDERIRRALKAMEAAEK
jgi:hypothetical protein